MVYLERPWRGCYNSSSIVKIVSRLVGKFKSNINFTHCFFIFTGSTSAKSYFPVSYPTLLPQKVSNSAETSSNNNVGESPRTSIEQIPVSSQTHPSCKYTSTLYCSLSLIGPSYLPYRHHCIKIMRHQNSTYNRLSSHLFLFFLLLHVF